jgi:hypothetical protein
MQQTDDQNVAHATLPEEEFEVSGVGDFFRFPPLPSVPIGITAVIVTGSYRK